jgi:galactonate dehydratase
MIVWQNLTTPRYSMKITSIELFTVPPRWLFLKLATDEGLCGWGEPIVEGHAHTVEAAVREMEEALIGRDPDHIEDIWQVLYRARFYRGGPIMMSAIAGVDQALWDIKGQRYGLPIYQLLGGPVRDKVRVYAWVGGESLAELAQSARERVQAGFNAVKMGASNEMHYIESPGKLHACVERIAAVREAVGPDVGIGVDFHGRLHKSMAKVLASELEPYHLMFIEEPVLPENNEALCEIVAHTSIPIATGERMYSRWDFKALLASGYVDIVQPDVSHAGGITETRKIAAMAEAYDVAVAPHCPLGPIAFAACLQVDAVSPNAIIQEQILSVHEVAQNPLLEYLVEPNVFKYEAGYVPLPAGNGLGIAINEEVVREAAKQGHRWRSPIWRNDDRTVAEW